MKTIEQKLTALADKAYKDKVKIEKVAIEKRYLGDKQMLEQILEIVKSRLVYKEVGDSWSKKYLVVTEEMLFEDYTTEPKNSWNRGTKIEKNGKYFTITVNGHRYSHLGELFKTYRNDIEEAIKKNQQESDMLYEKRKTIENLEKEEPKIKQMLSDYITLTETFDEQ